MFIALLLGLVLFEDDHPSQLLRHGAATDLKWRKEATDETAEEVLSSPNPSFA